MFAFVCWLLMSFVLFSNHALAMIGGDHLAAALQTYPGHCQIMTTSPQMNPQTGDYDHYMASCTLISPTHILLPADFLKPNNVRQDHYGYWAMVRFGNQFFKIKSVTQHPEANIPEHALAVAQLDRVVKGIFPFSLPKENLDLQKAHNGTFIGCGLYGPTTGVDHDLINQKIQAIPNSLPFINARNIRSYLAQIAILKKYSNIYECRAAQIEFFFPLKFNHLAKTLSNNTPLSFIAREKGGLGFNPERHATHFGVMQMGDDGGPLFDNSGNLIGINARFEPFSSDSILMQHWIPIYPNLKWINTQLNNHVF